MNLSTEHGLNRADLKMCIKLHEDKVVSGHVMKAYEGMEVQLHSLLTSILDGVGSQPRIPAALPRRKKLATSIL